ncbi:hypothetical protein ABTX77_35745 [Streptomyces sp. NPDC097704]|uniref:hypothetical protein n=1 Tax=Streptomyces sp. NPDC097704 TaxID=3157101 RepID=UPI0033207C67
MRQTNIVASHTAATGRRIQHWYATWHLLRRPRRRSHLRTAVYLLDSIKEQDLPLATGRQAGLERWMTSGDIRLRQEAGHFVRRAPEEEHELLHATDRLHVEKEFEALGYTVISEHPLRRRYDGVSDLVSSYPPEHPPAWWIRFFDYL